MGEGKFYDEWAILKGKLNLKELTPNCSRHTCATALSEANVPPAIIMDILGHEKYDTSLNYTHTSIEERLKALNNINL